MQLRDRGLERSTWWTRIRRVTVWHGITAMHVVLLAVWSCLLLRYTGRYRALYARSALAATMCSNALLFGVSDILAQCIAAYFRGSVDPVPQVVDNAAANIMQLYNDSSTSLHDDGYLTDEDTLSMFNSYGAESHPASLQPAPEQPISCMDRLQVFEFWRWFTFIAWGTGISFFQVPWYKILNYMYTEDPTVVQVLERVLSDQLLYSPVSLYCFFTYSNYVMESGDSATHQIKIQRLFLSTLGCNYMLWPLVQFINFLCIPKHFQVPFSSTIGVLWNCFLSMRNASHSI